MRQVPRTLEVWKIKVRTILGLLFLIAMAIAPLAHAAVPVAISATFAGGFTVVNTQLADGNTILTIDNSIHFQGDVQGVCEDKTELLILHPDGSDNFQATCTFSAIIQGASGLVTLTFDGRGQGLTFHGAFAIVQATGELRNMNLQGVFSGSFTSATTFAGNVSGQLV